MRKFTIKFFLLLFTFYFLLFTFSISPVFAREDNIGQSKIYPTHPLFFLKSVREILELKFAPANDIKAIRYLEFSQRRIREVKSLVEARHFEMIAPTLEHYIFNLHKALDLTDLKNEAKVRQLTEIVSLHVRVLEEIYRQIDSKNGQRAIRTTLFKINELLTNRLLPTQALICDFLIKEASSSALNEVEIAVLKERVLVCLQGLK